MFSETVVGFAFFRRCRPAVLVEGVLYYTFPVKILCFRGVTLLGFLDLPWSVVQPVSSRALVFRIITLYDGSLSDFTAAIIGDAPCTILW